MKNKSLLNKSVSPETPGPVVWKNPWRWLLSLFLLWHLLAVVSPPLLAISYGTGQPSPFAEKLFSLFRPYVGLLYLDHGYAFFAPQPGPLHLVRYKVEFADGRETIEKQFPNLEEHWPRLRYHRYFMIAESLEAAYVPATQPPPPLPPPAETPNAAAIQRDQERLYQQQIKEWRLRRSQYEQLRDSLIAHLQTEYPEGKITLTRIRHRLLSPPEYTLQKIPLNDPETYIPLPDEQPVLDVLPTTDASPAKEDQP